MSKRFKVGHLALFLAGVVFKITIDNIIYGESVRLVFGMVAMALCALLYWSFEEEQ